MPSRFLSRQQVGAGLILAWPVVAVVTLLLPTRALRADGFSYSLALIVAGVLIAFNRS
jgi:hypothetical protein